jgi:bifunctional non-homologous end joining protein LigD
MTVVKETQLFFQEGNSDKVYEAAIVDDGDGTFSVAVRWGRRGPSLNTGKKAQGVTRASADKVFDRLVREKTGKGYEIQTDAHVPAATAPPEGQGSSSKAGVHKRAVLGPKAQLMNPVDDDAQAEQLLTNDAWLAQQKLDGQRVLLHVDAGTRPRTFGTNRHGEETSVPNDVCDGASSLPAGTILDGELLDGAYMVFDILQLGAVDMRARPCSERYACLTDDVEPGLSEPISIVAAAVTSAQKAALRKRLTDNRAEGMIFKQLKAPYASGRPSSGGTQRKWKFTKSADVVVVENAGNAYRMQLRHGNAWVDVGKVFSGTTNASRAVLDGALKVGARIVCEVQYLYASSDFQLVQPVFVRARDDKDAHDCTHDQLVQTNKSVDDGDAC